MRGFPAHHGPRQLPRTQAAPPGFLGAPEPPRAVEGLWEQRRPLGQAQVSGWGHSPGLARPPGSPQGRDALGDPCTGAWGTLCSPSLIHGSVGGTRAGQRQGDAGLRHDSSNPVPHLPSFERLLLHALCQYMDLVSASKSPTLVCLVLVLLLFFLFSSSLSLPCSSASSSPSPPSPTSRCSSPITLLSRPKLPPEPRLWRRRRFASAGGRDRALPGVEPSSRGGLPGPALPGSASLAAALPFLLLFLGLDVSRQEAARGAPSPVAAASSRRERPCPHPARGLP